MKFLRKFNEHTSYEAELNEGGVDNSLPNVSYCEDVKDVHYLYNLVRFYVGEITGTTPQTVSIYTDESTHIDVTVSEGNKWYSYVLPKDKGLHSIKSGVFNPNVGWTNGIVKKVVIKANINYDTKYDEDSYKYYSAIPTSTIEASFNGSDTSKVIDMGWMFSYCSSLTSLDVSSFNTSNVQSMNGMFFGCSGLTSLDVSSFNTSNVFFTASMFALCGSLTSLDVSNFNTSNVAYMDGMFYGCSGLTSLDLSKLDTSKVTSMAMMFFNCINLTFLDLSKWDTSKVTNVGINMDSMFEGCGKLKTIRMKDCTDDTINKIQTQLTTDGITGVTITTK